MTSFISHLSSHPIGLTVAKSMTVASVGLFAGVALSYNVIIMPALRKISTESALPVWAESYNIGKNLQVSLILTSIITGSTVYFQTENPYYIAAPLIMGTIVPYTVAFLMPVNTTLLSILDGKKSDGSIGALFDKWDLLHFGRTVASTVALGLILYGEFSGHKLIAV